MPLRCTGAPIGYSTAKAEVTVDYVINGLRAEAEFRGEGSTHGARIRAFELLGRYKGLFEERNQGNQGLNVTIIEQLVVNQQENRVEVIGANGDGHQNGKALSGPEELHQE